MRIDDFFNALWLITVTITTVGYGDIVPHTIAGRTTCMVAAIGGSFLLSLVILSIASMFDLDENQTAALHDI